jgi:hypothetical protein
MPRFVHILWITAASILFNTCARDVNPDVDAIPYPDEVRIAYRTRAPFTSDYWYYMVFNYSAAPNTSTPLAPFDEVSNEDRGTNWEMYIAYHKDEVAGDQLVMLQRPRVPTILATAARPVDVTAGVINDDTVKDLLVACADGDVVQLIRGIDPDYLDPVYFEAPQSFDTGPQPLRLRLGDYTSDGKLDLSIVYAGRGNQPAVIRVLAQTAVGVYSALPDSPVADTPIDAVVGDFNFDNQGDWAMLTRNEGSQAVNLRIYLGDGAGAFAEDASFSVDQSAVEVIASQLNSAGIDLLVAQRGPAGGTGSVAIFNSTEQGVFSAGPVLDVAGSLNSLATEQFLGSTRSLVAAYNSSDGNGRVALYLNDGNQNFTLDSTLSFPTPANYITSFDPSSDGVPDAVVLNGDLDSGTGNSLFMVRGGRKADISNGTTSFVWDSLLVDYLTGNASSRVVTDDLNGDSKTDLLIPNSGSGTNGNSICVFYGLGSTNFASADVYWTDELPEYLAGQEWLLSQSISSNTFEIVIDPGVFYDLARIPPEKGRGFNVTFMTATTGIYYEANPDHLGEVRDVLLQPINIPMTVGHYDDEQNTPLANANIESDPAADIDNWRVEVN